MFFTILLAGTAAGQTFQNRTSTWISGGIPGKVAWGDYNGDGWVDLCAGGAVYRNNGGSSFTNTGQSSGSDSIWGDYNNDGKLDLFNYASHTLYRNTGIAFTNESSKLPAFAMSNTRGAVWADLDNDAYIDLYVGGYESPGYEPDMILRNEAGSRFTAAWTQSGDVDPARGITAADYDRDGDQDIYVSNYRLEANLLWRNNGDFSFTNAAKNGGVAGEYDGWSYSYGHTIGSCWGDFDNDGYLDLFVGNFSHPDAWQDRAKFYRNKGPAGGYDFQLMDTFDGDDWQESYASPAAADYDNDGDLDLFFTTVYAVGSYGIHNYPRLYRNDGNWKFTNVTDSMGLGSLGPTYQAAWADVDNDGDLDLATDGKLFINNTQATGRHWLKIGLEGDGENVNRAAIGAQVRVYAGSSIITRQIESGTGEGNQNDLTMHFGLGTYNQPVKVEILWPEGTLETVEGVEIDQTHQWEWGALSTEIFLGPGTDWNYDAYWKDGSSPKANATLPGLRVENNATLQHFEAQGTTQIKAGGNGVMLGSPGAGGGTLRINGGAFLVNEGKDVVIGAAGTGPAQVGSLVISNDGVFYSSPRVLVGDGAEGLGILGISGNGKATIANSLILGSNGGTGKAILYDNATLRANALVVYDGIVSFRSGSNARFEIPGTDAEQYARLVNSGQIGVDGVPISTSFRDVFWVEESVLMLASSFHGAYEGPGTDWNADGSWVDGSSPGSGATLDERLFVFGNAVLEHTAAQGTTTVTGHLALGRPGAGNGVLYVRGGTVLAQSDRPVEIGVGASDKPTLGVCVLSDTGVFASLGDVVVGGGAGGSMGFLNIGGDSKAAILGEGRLILGRDGATGIVNLRDRGTLRTQNLVISSGYVSFLSDSTAMFSVAGQTKPYYEDLFAGGLLRIDGRTPNERFDDLFVVDQDTLMLAWGPLEGDLDGDGYVGSGDLDLVRGHWGQSVTPGDLSSGDPSGDGLVGAADLDLVRAAWGTGRPPASVPEPGLWVLVAVGAVCAARWRTRWDPPVPRLEFLSLIRTSSCRRRSLP